MGNSFSIPISGEDIHRCWIYIAGQANYASKLQDNLQAMEQALGRLIKLRDDVKDRVDHAELQDSIKRLPEVELWLSLVEKEIAGANQLIQVAPQQKKKLCLAGCFSKNCCPSNRFGKEVVQKLETLDSLQGKGEFKEVAESVPAAAQMNFTESTVGLRREFDSVWSCIEKEDEGIIQIWGEKGIGKTHLLTQIHNTLLTMQNGFDFVIRVTISPDLRMKEVQKDIGEMIGFSSDAFENKTYYERGQCIFNVLKKRKFVLLLDDFWPRIDLRKVGIPFLKKGSKLIFTTRFEDVCLQMTTRKEIEVCNLYDQKEIEVCNLYDQMTTRKVIEVHRLTRTEAWELFVKNVGEETIASHPDIPDLAEEVIKECDGLPLALITIGRAVACKKTPEAWKYAIDVYFPGTFPAAAKMNFTESTVGLRREFDSVWSCIEKDDEGIIQIRGEKGIGKTHLLTQIYNTFLTMQNGFDFVIRVTISPDLTIEEVQKDIGEMIGFPSDEFENKTLYERGQCIFNVLKKRKFVLLLDDLWPQIDLRKVGIPFLKKGSMLIFTTRLRYVCYQMRTQKEIEVCHLYDQMTTRKVIEVYRLTRTEAWELFVTNVGEETIASHPDIPDLAEEVIKECDGLPLALITIGRALACKKTPQTWEDAIDVYFPGTVPAAAKMNFTESTVALRREFDFVWSCIEKEDEVIIAIWGKAGIGKTHLLTQIHNTLLTMQNGFDFVIWVTMSPDLRIEEFQKDIGEMIGFSSDEFENKTFDERGECIFNVLKNRKFVLLLDDLWPQIDLRKVGIPFPKKGSKLIFTTRFWDVCDQMTTRKGIEVCDLCDQMTTPKGIKVCHLCDQMTNRKVIEVHSLTRAEAWELFVKNVGEETIASHPDIPDLAKKVIKECDGLPLSLITIGRAMACKKTPQAWEDAIDDLRRSTSYFPGTVPAAAKMNFTESTVGLRREFDFVWSYIEKEDEGIITIWGKAGIGKTHLLTQIHNSLPRHIGFDIIIWATVSRGLKIEKIQKDIWEKIGFSSDEFENKTIDERGECIFDVLEKRKFVLLLDDLWERIDLRKVGIPFPKKGSKLIFTTRFLDLCGQMTTGKKIKVYCLKPKEAWELFVKNVGEETLASHPDIPDLAQEVLKECNGLPLSLITIGRAMACKKTPQAWKEAIKFLNRSVPPGTRTMKLFDRILKFNYDCLPDDKFRSCFLYCCLFPEDFKIKIDDLIDCWIGEGFVEEYHPAFPCATRNRGLYIIDWLRSASLLEGNEEYVKMHDLIRNIGLCIASELEEERCLVEARAKLAQIPKVEAWNKVKRLSLMDNEIEFLEGTEVPPTCSNLRSLFLRKNRLKMIYSEFFQCMPNLTVLDLSENTNIWNVPVGISELVSLEYLNLSWTNITELPVELKSLKKLKCLNLDHIYKLRTIPGGVISSFEQLLIFRMFNSGYLIDEDNECLVLKELGLLGCLNTLTITIKRRSALQRFLSSHNLQSRTERMSLFHFGDSEALNVACFASMERLREICFSRLTSLEELKIRPSTRDINFPGMIWLKEMKIEPVILSKSCFNDLRQVHISECHVLRELTWLVLAKNVKHLVVKWCGNLEAIISKEELRLLPTAMENPNPPFTQLEQLDLIGLHQLKSIYWHALPFPRLLGLDVHCCPMLRKLPLNSKSAENQKTTIKGEKVWWDELEWEDETTRNSFLKSFVSHD